MRIRIWDGKTGKCVGEVEQRGYMDIIWFAPSFTRLVAEKPAERTDEPGHFDLSIIAETPGPYLMTHTYLGIPSLPYGREKEQAADEA